MYTNFKGDFYQTLSILLQIFFYLFAIFGFIALYIPDETTRTMQLMEEAKVPLVLSIYFLITLPIGVAGTIYVLVKRETFDWEEYKKYIRIYSVITLPFSVITLAFTFFVAEIKFKIRGYFGKEYRQFLGMNLGFTVLLLFLSIVYVGFINIMPIYDTFTNEYSAVKHKFEYVSKPTAVDFGQAVFNGDIIIIETEESGVTKIEIDITFYSDTTQDVTDGGKLYIDDVEVCDVTMGNVHHNIKCTITDSEILSQIEDVGDIEYFNSGYYPLNLSDLTTSTFYKDKSVFTGLKVYEELIFTASR